jgi:hypothetical protein
VQKTLIGPNVRNHGTRLRTKI